MVSWICEEKGEKQMTYQRSVCIGTMCVVGKKVVRMQRNRKEKVQDGDVE